MRSFFDALEFLTVMRLRPRPPAGMSDVSRAIAWFPIVGLLLGAVLLGIDRAASRALPLASADVLLVVALAALTGALHLDGLADAADGLFGGHTPSERLEIMRDVHAGTYAIVAVASLLALKWAGLAALPRNVRFEALLLVPCLARAAMAATVAAYPAARQTGMAAEMKRDAAQWRVAVAVGSAALAAVVLLGAGGVYATVFALAAALAFGAFATKLTGGMTGDLYGATAEISEASVLLFIAALAQRGWIDAFAFGS